jgi:hypothetical protein
MEHSSVPDGFYNLRMSTDRTESEMFDELINSLQIKHDFSKVNTLGKYIAFRNDLASQYVEQASKEVLLKIARATLAPRPVKEVVVTNTSQVSKTTKRNRSRRKAQHSKTKSVVTVPTPVVIPPDRPPIDIDPPFIKRRRIAEGPVPTWDSLPHVKYMPVIEDLNMTSFNLNLTRCTVGNQAKIQPVKHRTTTPNQYRVMKGLHKVEEQCHLCDELALRNFLDGAKSQGDRTPALVALHIWISHGGTWNNFNDWRLPWYEKLVPYPGFVDYKPFDAYFTQYLESEAYKTDGAFEVDEPYSDADMLFHDLDIETEFLFRPVKLLPPVPYTHNMTVGPSQQKKMQ